MENKYGITDWNWKWNDTWLQISGQRLGLKMEKWRIKNYKSKQKMKTYNNTLIVATSTPKCIFFKNV